ncbi:MAG: tetratricopeptide repeat protein, partial [Deltaproteobacteria bacterium]|nr:tetratricopeptide repeat protein [Deltaproteobacteria bacterium]
PFELAPRGEADRLLLAAARSEDPAEAELLYRQVTELRPFDPLAWGGLARAQVAQGNSAEAGRHARRAMRYARATNDVFAIQDSEQTLGLVLVQSGRADAAASVLMDSMFGSDGSEMGCAYQGLGELFARLETVRPRTPATAEEALDAFDRGRPDDVSSVADGEGEAVATAQALGRLFERDIDGAERSLSSLAGPDRAVVEGHVLVARRRHDDARRLLSEALPTLEEAPRGDVLRRLAWLGLGWAESNAGRYSQSLDWFDQLLAERPEHLLGLLGKANSLAWLGDGDGSEALLREVLAADPGNPYALAEIAGIQLDRGALDDAEASYRAAMETTGAGYTCPWEGLGLVYLQRGQLDEAAVHLEKAVAINPDIEFRKYNGLARIYLARGETERARQMLERSIANFPHDPEAKRLLDELGSR